MLALPPAWLRESLIGMSADDCEATPFAGKWSYRGMIEHVVNADLDWTDILYRAVRPLRPQHGAWNPEWRADFDRRRKIGDINTAIDVMAENHAQFSTWIRTLDDEDFLQPFPGVLWLIEAGLKVVVADSGRWGLYLHPYHHLAYLQRHRVALGKPLPTMDRYLERPPGFDAQTPWPPWTATSN